jgi:hypothetical protein
MGYKEVTFAGISVKTRVALAYLASWYVKVLTQFAVGLKTDLALIFRERTP